MEYWMDPPICFPQVHQFPSPSPVFTWFLTLYNPEGNSVWDFNSSKPRTPKFTSLEGAHPFHQERRRKLSPTPTPTFQLLQLTGQILIGNYNSINWGWWIIGSVRKALRQGRLVDGSRILLWSCGGRDNRKQLGFLRQRIGRGLAWNPLVFLIQGWLHPQKKTLGWNLGSTRDEGDRDQIRDKVHPREHLENRAWISWLEGKNTWLQGNSIVWKFMRSGYNIQAPSGHREFIKGYCSGIFQNLFLGFQKTMFILSTYTDENSILSFAQLIPAWHNSQTRIWGTLALTLPRSMDPSASGSTLSWLSLILTPGIFSMCHQHQLT